MSHILHVAPLWDPAGDTFRCVNEVNRFSKYQHKLVVRWPHPLPVMQLPAPKEFYYELPEWALEGAGAVLCHFVGWPDDWPEPKCPMAFRNLNIRYVASTDRFWSEDGFNCRPDKRYQFVSASHVGAADFLDWAPFRWLPDLLPMDAEEYSPSFTERPKCVSYIKHADELEQADFGAGVKRLNMVYQPHAEILARRKNEATVVIDNWSDGHPGLAGHESIALGLPTVVFSHAKTLAALDELCGGQWSRGVPFSLVSPDVEDAVSLTRSILSLSSADLAALRREICVWTRKFFDSQRLIRMYWDAAFDELVT